MSTTQHELWPDHTFYKDTGRKEREPVWYYVHDLVTDKMLVLEKCGCWKWTQHDTVTSVPHIFSTLKLAKDQIRRLGHGTPKKYPWKP